MDFEVKKYLHFNPLSKHKLKCEKLCAFEDSNVLYTVLLFELVSWIAIQYKIKPVIPDSPVQRKPRNVDFLIFLQYASFKTIAIIFQFIFHSNHIRPSLKQESDIIQHLDCLLSFLLPVGSIFYSLQQEEFWVLNLIKGSLHFSINQSLDFHQLSSHQRMKQCKVERILLLRVWTKAFSFYKLY